MKKIINSPNKLLSRVCAIIVGSLISVHSPVYAACNLPADFKMSRAIHYGPQLLECMRNGEDLPVPFRNAHIDTGKNIYGIFPKVITPPGHPINGDGTKLALTYRDLFCDGTRPGGLSSNGATQICQTGQGIQGSLIPLLRIPSLGIDLSMMQCVSGILGAMGGGGNFSNVFSANGSVNQCGPGCASGSVGFCGIGFSSGCVCPLGPQGGQVASVLAGGANAQMRFDGEQFVSMNTSNFNINVQENLDALRGSTFYLPTGGLATVQLPDGQMIELELLENQHIVIDQETGRLFAGGPNGGQNIFSGGFGTGNLGNLPGIELPQGTQISLTANTVNGVAGNVVVPESVLMGSLGIEGLDVMQNPGQLIYSNTAQAAHVPSGNALGRTAFQQVTAPKTTELTGLVGQYASEYLNINTNPQLSAGAFAPSPAANEDEIVNNALNQSTPLRNTPIARVPD